MISRDPHWYKKILLEIVWDFRGNKFVFANELVLKARGLFSSGAGYKTPKFVLFERYWSELFTQHLIGKILMLDILEFAEKHDN